MWSADESEIIQLLASMGMAFSQAPFDCQLIALVQEKK
jgi:hypothetical protein